MQIEQTYEIGLNIVRKKIFFRQCPLHSFWVEQGVGGYLTNMKRNKVDAGLKVEAARPATLLQRME
jgi:hypothetical protein